MGRVAGFVFGWISLDHFSFGANHCQTELTFMPFWVLSMALAKYLVLLSSVREHRFCGNSQFGFLWFGFLRFCRRLGCFSLGSFSSQPHFYPGILEHPCWMFFQEQMRVSGKSWDRKTARQSVGANVVWIPRKKQSST